ncbi:MAG: ornithine cyclodeaminase [Desulfurococcales archaeon ex4484_58]|nr:MAG: ornithine cyclodeaminase [Desulfurococcales archaeon ex4484_58]
MVEIIFLKGSELEELLKPEILVDEIAKAFKLFSEGKTVTPPRTVMWIEGNWWGIMQSYVPEYGVGVKIVNIIPANLERGLPTIQAIVTLFDPVIGSPLAVMEGGVLTALRTGAASAVSTKYMAPREEGALAIIGTGYQARYQLRFVSTYFKPVEVRIYDVREEAMNSFKKYAEELGFRVVKCSSLEEVFKNARVVIEASTTKTPVIHGKYLEPPVHVISIGAHIPEARALDDETIKHAENIVVDSREAVLKETGDIRIPLEKGLIKMEDIAELGEVVAGKKTGRKGGGITIFKSVGLAIQDACAAGLAYRLAKEKNIGRKIEL